MSDATKPVKAKLKVAIVCDWLTGIGGAERIVTQNLRDLRRMELKFPRLEAVTPGQFLKEVNK